MSKVKALDELRELGEKVKNSCFTGVHCDDVIELADDIEAEIAERFMELPVDAEGVPIHMDDMLKSENASKPFIVESMTFADSWTVWDRENGATRWPSECHHVKPRTIEDVLREFGKAYTYVDGECASTTTLIADYADELRSMGVGE